MVFKSRLDRPRLEPFLQGVLFLGLFCYLWKGIETHLLYHGFGVFTAYPIFSLEGSFFRTSFSTPGGALDALAALLSQSYYSAWLGALVIMTVLGMLLLGIQRLLHSLQTERFRDLAWIPLIVAVMIYNHYDNPLSAILAITLSVWTALLYGSLPVRNPTGRVGIFLVFIAVLYFLGATAAFVFATIVGVTESLFHRKVTLAILMAGLACGVPFVMGRLLFNLEPQRIYSIGTAWDSLSNHSFSPASMRLTFVLYILIPGSMVAVFMLKGLMRTVLKRRHNPRKQGTKLTNPPTKGAKRRKARSVAGSRSQIVPRPKTPRHREKINQKGVNASTRNVNHSLWIGLRMLIVSTTAVACLMLSRSHIRDERALHYYAQQRDWDQVLSLGRRMRSKLSFTRSGVFDINRALAHRGRLAEELCAYPQEEIHTLFFSFEGMTGRLQYAKSIELYLDLGYLNAAEKTAYELLENEGPSPYVLEALVRIHLAQGEDLSAKILFEALRKYVGANAYVNKWEAVMTDPKHTPDHPLIQSWRKKACTRNVAVLGIAFEPMLKRLLQDAPDHRLAYEYLMAYYLLKHQRAQLVTCLPLLGSFQYPQLPRHCAEALLLNAMETRTSVDTEKWTIDPNLQQQSRDIMRVVQGAHGDNQAVFDTLAPKYGDTYTFYSLFNVCGVK